MMTNFVRRWIQKVNSKYHDGRFFISPLIGCRSNCIYCYLVNDLDKPKVVRKNKNSIKEILTSIRSDKRFEAGPKGSIISIGAYCDVFPINDRELINFSVEWIISLLKIGNPVQVISKNVLSEDLIKLICKNIQYPKQLLYSTTITSFTYWSQLEKNTKSPYERLETLKLFKNNGVHTNVMIKPFLPSITEFDSKEFITKFTKNTADYCVVGDLYLADDKILELLTAINNDDKNKNRVDGFNSEILDCTENKQFTILLDSRIDEFINKLRKSGISVFKKSSCVNANILAVKNVSGYYKSISRKYCVSCGNCDFENIP